MRRYLAAAPRPCGLIQLTKPVHPKVQALADVVAAIATAEVQKVEKDPSTWVSKVLVFNKLIKGTAPHLREVSIGSGSGPPIGIQQGPLRFTF